jgi:GTPase
MPGDDSGSGHLAARVSLQMPIPRIAIVGRPNVGKSSLLNMIAHAKVSIVDPTPGTTRDRVSVIADLEAPDSGPLKPVEVVDTGGYGVYVAEGQRFNEIGADLGSLTKDIEGQIAEAVSTADLILFCIDAQVGITPQDEEMAQMLREGKFGTRTGAGDGGGAGSGDGGPKQEVPPIRVVATKVDGPKWEAHGYEAAALGLGEPLLVSAKSNYFRRDFLDALYEMLPAPEVETGGPAADMMLALIGKRNAGKSSLINALAGEKRVIVSEIAGTTRDAVDVRFEMDGKSLVAIDTAGLRRKKSFANRIEWWAFDRAQRSIDRADVVLMLIDATETISQVDQQLAMLVQKAFKPVVIVVNKWDAVEGRPGRTGRPVTTEDYETYLRKEVKGLAFAPLAFVSAETGLNVRRTIALAFEMLEQSRMRVPTGKINRLVQGILERHNPPSKLGTRAKAYYIAQVAVEPPTIVMVVNRPELFTPNYQRFLLNRFREELPFGEVPIRLLVRARKQTREGGIDMIEEPMTEEEVLAVEQEAAAALEGPIELDEFGQDAEDYFEEGNQYPKRGDVEGKRPEM